MQSIGVTEDDARDRVRCRHMSAVDQPKDKDQSKCICVQGYHLLIKTVIGMLVQCVSEDFTKPTKPRTSSVKAISAKLC